MKKLYNNKGYTLLFAAITAALVLGVAVFILSVSRKQFILASTARDSMFSIYAADSGIECVALRNADFNGSRGVISSSTINDGIVTLNCNGNDVPLVKENNPNSLSHPSFDEESGFVISAQGTAYIDTGGNTCAYIIVTTGENGGTNQSKKVFDSRGYNLCQNDGTGGVIPVFDSPRTVERALRLTLGQ